MKPPYLSDTVMVVVSPPEVPGGRAISTAISIDLPRLVYSAEELPDAILADWRRRVQAIHATDPDRKVELIECWCEQWVLTP